MKQVTLKDFNQLSYEDISQKYEDLKKIWNIETKKIFYTWINKAINEKKKEEFNKCVKEIGRAWHVSRNVAEGCEDVFCNHLWDNKDNIRKGDYNFCKKAALLKTENGKKSHAFSYESKVCFLIAPEKYKIIYDENNRASLNNELSHKVTLNNFQDSVDEYIEKYKKEYNKKNLSIEDYFEIDYKLWNKCLDDTNV